MFAGYVYMYVYACTTMFHVDIPNSSISLSKEFQSEKWLYAIRKCQYRIPFNKFCIHGLSKHVAIE